MKLKSYYLIGYIFIFLHQVRSSDVDAKQWSFIFPKSINALKNSDVTIPCTFTAPVNHREVNLIWYIYRSYGYPQVFNSKDPSKVLEDYRGHTSLVANGTDSCSLRIKDMTTTEKFYPGISEEINSYQLNSKQNVEVKVTGCSDDGSCKKWTFEFPSFVSALEGSCVDIPCTFTHPEDAKDFNFFWYANKNKIFNNKTPSDVLDEYKGWTFLTGNTENDCSLKIINVGKKEDYYPGINDEINSIRLKHEKVLLTVKENPPEPTITGTENLKDKKTCNISCSVNHTCPSSPPTLTWSVSGHPIMEGHEDLDLLGKWRMKSIMTYTASYTDDKTDLECAVTFPNNKTSVKTITLNIKYAPTGVQVIVLHPTEGATELKCSFARSNPDVTRYTWMKDGNRIMNTTGPILVLDGKEDEFGSYACIAHNAAGSSASAELDFKDSKDPAGNEDSPNLLLILGISAGVILLVMIVFFYTRIKACQTSSKPENIEQPETTYTELMKSEVQNDYDSLMPSSSAQPAVGQRDLTSDNHYENLPRNE